MNANVTVEFNKLPQIAQRIPTVVVDALNLAVGDVAEYQGNATPVDKGPLRANTTANLATVGNFESSFDWNQEYSVYVEEGRGSITAKPGKFLVFEIDGVTIFARQVGPAAAQPFAKPSHDYAAENLKRRLSDMERQLV